MTSGPQGVRAAAFPMLSTAERDRRWRAFDQLMDRLDLAALVVCGGSVTVRWDQYATNESNRGIAVFVRGAAPVYLVGHGNYALARVDASGRAYDRWVDDARTGPPYANLVDLLRTHRLQRSRIGVVGLTSRAVLQRAGWIPFTAWQQVLGELPDAAFVDVAGDFERLAIVKSAEELTLLRHAAQLGEVACRDYAAACRPGRRESEVAAAALHAIIAGGGWSHMLVIRSGEEALGWTVYPEWIAQGGGSRVLAGGDLVASELFPSYAGYESQQQIQVNIGAPDGARAEAARVARASYDAGIAVARPGTSFAELCDAMHAPIHDAGCWVLSPLVQTLSPVLFNSAIFVDAADQPALAGIALPAMAPRDGDLVLEPGMAFAFQPNAVNGRTRVNIGGTVVITEDGCEELNQLSNDLVVVDG